MNQSYSKLTTESINPETARLDELTTEEMLRCMNRQDQEVSLAVEKEIPQIQKAVDILAQRLRQGGRMFYVGAGTSGRLGVLDASECMPTFSVDPELIQGYIAGGDIALRHAVEGCEDSREEGEALIVSCGVTEKDTVVGITASGSAAFVQAALEKARALGAATIGVVNNKDSQLEPYCDICISPVVGPEIIMGSTRLKSGTAQKLVLNMLTTCTMVKLGKVYNNLMVDLSVSNKKLYDRALRIISMATGTKAETAKEYLEKAGMSPKLAILMIQTGLDVQEAHNALKKNDGFLKKAIASVQHKN